MGGGQQRQLPGPLYVTPDGGPFTPWWKVGAWSSQPASLAKGFHPPFFLFYSFLRYSTDPPSSWSRCLVHPSFHQLMKFFNLLLLRVPCCAPSKYRNEHCPVQAKKKTRPLPPRPIFGNAVFIAAHAFWWKTNSPGAALCLWMLGRHNGSLFIPDGVKGFNMHQRKCSWKSAGGKGLAK